MKSPIVLFVYNRPGHTRNTVEALQKNEGASESELFVFADGPKDRGDEIRTTEVRKFIRNITGFKSLYVSCSERNKGLAESITSGIDEVLRHHDRVIVLEDDLVTSPQFLKFMNLGLELYDKEEDVISIHGYVYPIKEKLPATFFLKGADCWGWATWKRGWSLFQADGKVLMKKIQELGLSDEFDFDRSYPYSRMLSDQIAGRNNSWAIRWYASAFVQNKLTLYPGRSLVHNIGFDGSGTHARTTGQFDVPDFSEIPEPVKILVAENMDARLIVSRHFRSQRRSLRGLLSRLKGILLD